MGKHIFAIIKGDNMPLRPNNMQIKYDVIVKNTAI
jgi:hypothetical protein